MESMLKNVGDVNTGIGPGRMCIILAMSMLHGIALSPEKLVRL